MTVKYFHMRVPQFEGLWRTHNKIEQMYSSIPCPKGGATVRVSNRDSDPLYVDVQVAYCSPFDCFCRKTGREVASATVSKIVPIGSLHRELASIYNKAMRMSAIPKKHRVSRSFLNVAHFFLPKY